MVGQGARVQGRVQGVKKQEVDRKKLEKDVIIQGQRGQRDIIEDLPENHKIQQKVQEPQVQRLKRIKHGKTKVQEVTQERLKCVQVEEEQHRVSEKPKSKEGIVGTKNKISPSKCEMGGSKFSSTASKQFFYSLRTTKPQRL